MVDQAEKSKLLNKQKAERSEVEKKLKNIGTGVEVINAGIIAQDSGGLRRVAKQVLEQN